MCRPLSRGTHFSKMDTRGPGNSICADPCREVQTSPKRARGVPEIPYVPTPVERCKLLQNGHAGSRQFHMCRWLVGWWVGGGMLKRRTLILGMLRKKEIYCVLL